MTEGMEDLMTDMKRLNKGISLFLDRGDEVSIQIFKECMREAFEQ